MAVVIWILVGFYSGLLFSFAIMVYSKGLDLLVCLFRILEQGRLNALFESFVDGVFRTGLNKGHASKCNPVEMEIGFLTSLALEASQP